MIRFLLLAGLATALLPGEAEAKRGGRGGVHTLPAAKSRTVVAPVPAGTARPARVPFPPAAAIPVALRTGAAPAVAPNTPWCGADHLVGGFCVVN